MVCGGGTLIAQQVLIEQSGKRLPSGNDTSESRTPAFNGSGVPKNEGSLGHYTSWSRRCILSIQLLRPHRSAYAQGDLHCSQYKYTNQFQMGSVLWKHAAQASEKPSCGARSLGCAKFLWKWYDRCGTGYYWTRLLTTSCIRLYCMQTCQALLAAQCVEWLPELPARRKSWSRLMIHCVRCVYGFRVMAFQVTWRHMVGWNIW